MGRICEPGKGTDEDVCDSCGYVDNPDDGVLARDFFTDPDNPDNPGETYCRECLDAKGLEQCSKCLAFVPIADVNATGWPVCGECRRRG